MMKELIKLVHNEVRFCIFYTKQNSHSVEMPAANNKVSLLLAADVNDINIWLHSPFPYMNLFAD